MELAELQSRRRQRVGLVDHCAGGETLPLSAATSSREALASGDIAPIYSILLHRPHAPARPRTSDTQILGVGFTAGVPRPYDCEENVRYYDTARVEAVTSCVRDKIAGGEPFHVRLDAVDVDTTVSLLWVQSADRVMTLYHSYSNSPWLSARRCGSPRVAAVPPKGVFDRLIECEAVYGERIVCESDDTYFDVPSP